MSKEQLFSNDALQGLQHSGLTQGGFHGKFAAKLIEINSKIFGGDDKWVKYDEQRHGYEPFGNLFDERDSDAVVLKKDGSREPASDFVRYAGLETYKRYRRGDVEVRHGNPHVDIVKPKPNGKVFTYSLWN